jgi:hypothetical protein
VLAGLLSVELFSDVGFDSEVEAVPLVALLPFSLFL